MQVATPVQRIPLHLPCVPRGRALPSITVQYCQNQRINDNDNDHIAFAARGWLRGCVMPVAFIQLQLQMYQQ